MRAQCLLLFGALMVVVAVGSLVPVPVAGQAPASNAKVRKSVATKPWAAARTADGQPDLQGIWVNNSATPLERPAVFAGRAFLTEEEVIELKKRAARLFGSANNDFAGGDAAYLA